MRLRLLFLASVLTVLAACGGGDDPEPATTTTTTTTASTTTTLGLAADVRDWDGVRFDIGIVERIDRTEDGLTLIVFDRVQLESEHGRQEAKDFTTEPIVVGNTDAPFVNESKRLRTYVAAPGIDVLRIANLGQTCATDGNDAEPRWDSTTVDRVVDDSLWEDYPQVSLTFTPDGKVSRLRLAAGC